MLIRTAFTLILLLSSLYLSAQTFLSWNIRFDNPNDGPDRWELRREAMVKEIKRYKPAVIGLQEVVLGQLQYLGRSLPRYAYFGVGRDDGKEKGEFSPVFYDSTRYSLVSGQTLWLSPTPDVPSKGWDAALPRIATFLILKDKKSLDSLWVVNTHFDHIGKEARLHAAELIVQTLEPAIKTNRKVVFMGDLNAEPEEAPILLLKKHLIEACPASKNTEGTFNGFDTKLKKFRRIDYLWISPQRGKIASYRIPKPMVQGRHVSDHFPVLVKLYPD